MNITVEHHLRQTQNLEDFRHQDGPHKGKPVINMPYWIKLHDGWWFDFIRKGMDADTFLKNVSSGSVYILDKITEEEK